jgi:FkbM family methyltransferase
MPDRRPTKRHSLDKLIELGVPVGTVIDVGILTGTHELLSAYSATHQLLIEPIVEWNDTITSSYDKAGVDFELLNVAASNFDGTMMMETSTIRPGQPITHARLTEKSSGENLRKVQVRTLDTIVAERPYLKKPFLVKLDVDGVETQIIEGAKKILADSSVIIIEAAVGNLMSRANLLVNAGFALFDIVDLCYYDKRLWQVDLIFVNRKILQESKIIFNSPPSDMGKWEAFS